MAGLGKRCSTLLVWMESLTGLLLLLLLLALGRVGAAGWDGVGGGKSPGGESPVTARVSEDGAKGAAGMADRRVGSSASEQTLRRASWVGGAPAAVTEGMEKETREPYGPEQGVEGQDLPVSLSACACNRAGPGWSIIDGGQSVHAPALSNCVTE